MKICRICDTEKALSDFHKHKATKDGAQSYCKACYKEVNARRYVEKRSAILCANKEWRNANADRMREIARKWRLENRDRRNESANRWRIANRAKVLDSVARWRKQNPDRVKELSLKYRLARDPEKHKAYNREYRIKNLDRLKSSNRKNQSMNKARRAATQIAREAAKLKATPTWANLGKVKEFYLAADFLSMVTGEWHQVDHIVPLRSPKVCGLHWEGNCQVLSAAENAAKGNRFWPDMP